MQRLIILARYWNDMDMLQASLDQIDYWTKGIEAEVYLAEGAWDQKFSARSTDGTREYLETWAKRRSNVLVINNVRANKNYRINQAETSNLVLQIANWYKLKPDYWMLIVDVDHFYTKADIDKVKEMIKEEGDQFDFFTHEICNFLYDLQHCQISFDTTQSRLPSRLFTDSRWVQTNHLTRNGVFYKLHNELYKRELTKIRALHYEGLRPAVRLALRYSVGNRKTFEEFKSGVRIKGLIPFTGNAVSEFAERTLSNVFRS